MDGQPEPKPDYTALWTEYCKRVPLDRRIPQVEFIRQTRALYLSGRPSRERSA